MWSVTVLAVVSSVGCYNPPWLYRVWAVTVLADSIECGLLQSLLTVSSVGCYSPCWLYRVWAVTVLLTVSSVGCDSPCWLYRLWAVTVLAAHAGPRGLTFSWWGWYGLCHRHNPTKLAHSFLFCSCVCFCLYGPFNSISFHKYSRRLFAFSLCPSGLNSALLALSNIYLSLTVSLNPDIILCGWLGLKHLLTKFSLTTHDSNRLKKKKKKETIQLFHNETLQLNRDFF